MLGTWEGVVECGLAPDNEMRLFEAPGFKIRDEVLQAQRMIPSESQVIEMFSTFNEGWALEYTVGQGTEFTCTNGIRRRRLHAGIMRLLVLGAPNIHRRIERTT